MFLQCRLSCVMEDGQNKTKFACHQNFRCFYNLQIIVQLRKYIIKFVPTNVFLLQYQAVIFCNGGVVSPIQKIYFRKNM